MKKFYTLLAAAAVTVSSVSAAQRVAVDFVKDANNAKEAKVETQFVSPATVVAKAKTKGMKAIAAEDIIGTNFVQFYIVAESGWEGPEMEPFEIEAGEKANEYIIKNLIFGPDALDLKATYSTITEQGETFEVLTIGAGQDWLNNNGQMCKLGIGYANQQTGDWGGTLKSDASFLLMEQNGEKFWIPAWGFQGQTDDDVNGLAWGYEVDAQSWRGNVFPGCFIYPSNGTFSGEYTEDGQNFTSETDGIYAVVANRFGKKTIQLYNVAGANYPMTLNIADNVASATDQVYGDFYTDESHTSTTPVYFFNGKSTDEMLVSGTVGTEDGKSFLDFGTLYLFWPGEGAGMAWADAKVNFKNDYGFASAIKNVSADFDENAPVEYYNLQGVRVENPANGLYIKRQGNKAAKVIL